MRTVSAASVAANEKRIEGLPPTVLMALGELAGAAKDGLLALSVGVGLGVLHELMEAEIGVRTISIPSLRKISSKAPLNFESRSWIRKRGGEARSVSDHPSWRACCETQTSLGCWVQPAMWTLRLPSSMKNRT